MQNQRARLHRIVGLNGARGSQNHRRALAQNDVGTFLVALKFCQRSGDELRSCGLPVRAVDAWKALVENSQNRADMFDVPNGIDDKRSEERRVGKECRSRWS